MINSRAAAVLILSAILPAGAAWAQGVGKTDASAASFATTRGYFALTDHDRVVRVTSSADFQMCLWARNVETFMGGVQILTPASQFRGPGSSGPQDGLVMNVAAQTGLDLGCLAGRGGEEFVLTSAFSARVAIFVSLITAPAATASMSRE